MTQTRLSNFFQKTSGEIPRSSPDESTGDNLVICEKDLNAEDTTLKLEETEKLDNQQRNIHEDTTLKIDELEQSDNDDKEEGEDNVTKTFVINITLKGVPSDSKGFDNNTKHESNKRTHNDNASKVKESPSPKKVKPTAKRKIKALFGDSSGSDSESKDKKVKTEPDFSKRIKEHQHDSKYLKIDRDSKSKIEKHKSKPTKLDHCVNKQNNLTSEQNKRIKSESNETKSPRKDSKREKEEHRDWKKIERAHETKLKSSESKHNKPKKKDEKKSHKRTPEKQKTENVSKSKDVTSIFGDLSGSESEKELIIDEGLESVTNNEENVQDRQPTNSKDTEILEIEMDSGTDATKTLEHNMQQQQINNLDELNNSITEVDDNKLDKAHKLSIEADKVLQELKQFSEMPSEPDIVLEKKVELKVKSIDSSDVSRSTSNHKSQESKRHKLSLIGKIKDKHLVKERKDKRHSKIDNRKEKHLKPDEHLNEKSQDKEDPSKKSEKVDVASLVVKLLMPYYKKKKISSRDLFKITARHIVHQLLAIQVTGKITLN